MRNFIVVIVMCVLVCAGVFIVRSKLQASREAGQPGAASSELSEQEEADRLMMQMFAEIDQKIMEADALHLEGKLEEAAAKIKEVAAGYMHKAADRAFYAIFGFFMAHNQLNDAKEFIFNVNGQYPSVNVQDACRQVFDSLRATSQADAQAWTQRLLDSKLPDEAMRASIYQWMLMLAVDKKDVDLMKEAVGLLVQKAKPDVAVEMIQQAGLSAFQKPELVKFAEDLTALLKSLTAKDAAYENLNLVFEIRLVVLKKEWSSLNASIAKAVKMFPDKQLSMILRVVADGLRSDKRLFALNTVCEDLIFNVKDKPATSRSAANYWIEIAQIEEPYSVPSRIKRLMDAEFNRDTIASLYCNAFYKLIKSPKKLDDKELKAVNELADSGMVLFEKLPKEDSYYDSVKLVLLDSSFLSERYADATKLLALGMPGRDQAWVDSLMNKLNAHRCLKEGKYEESIQYFRGFTKYITDNGDEETIDPATGVTYTKGMILARNEKRIASIYEFIGKKDDAKKCRDEATRLFKEAQAKMASNNETLAVITEELATMNAAFKPDGALK